MHGLIVNQLRQYAVQRFGRVAWEEVVTRAGVDLGLATPTIDRVYEDDVVYRVVAAAVAISGVSAHDLLEDFGAFLAPTLLRVYEPMINPRWRTLDVIENTEERIHTAVRMRDSNAGPPYLASERVSPTQVDIIYTSPRRLCAVAEGIPRGLAVKFGEQIVVTQPECMLRGDERCLIRVAQVQ